MDMTRFENCLYECDLNHQRLFPKRYGFRDKAFLFYLNLDRLNELPRIPSIGLERFNLYGFNDRDYFPDGARLPLKTRVTHYLNQQGIPFQNGTIMLLTNLNVLGYVFNPVSFYFCFDSDGQPLCAIAEVTNTFREAKPFLILPDQTGCFDFRNIETKYFYVSPFSELTLRFDFRLNIPNSELHIYINSLSTYADQKNKVILASSIGGQQHKLTQNNLLQLTVKYPLMPQRIISLIHWHALILWLKRLPFFRKERHPHLQRGILNTVPVSMTRHAHHSQLLS